MRHSQRLVASHGSVRWPEAVASLRLPSEPGVRRFDSPGSSIDGSLSWIPCRPLGGRLACGFLVMAMSMEDLQIVEVGSSRLAGGLDMVDFQLVIHQEEESTIRTAATLCP